MTTPSHVPSGKPPEHAPARQIDLEAAANRLLADLSGHGRRGETLAREGAVSIVMMAMEAGNAVDEHSAGGPVSVHLLRGRAHVTAGGETIDLGPGQVVFLQPNVRHALRADEQSVVLLTVSSGA